MFLLIFLIIIICLLVWLLACMKMNKFDKISLNFSSMFYLLFFLSVFFNSFISSIYYISDKCMVFVFFSSGVFILSLTLILFFVSSLSQSVGISYHDYFSFSFSLYHFQSLYDITRFDMICCII